MPHVVARVTCKECGMFVGLLTSDGKGPWIEGCLTSAYACQLAVALQGNEPKRYALGLGGGRSGPLDPDSGGYQANARMHLEDW